MTYIHALGFAVTWWFRSPRTSSLLRGAVSVTCLCRVWMTIKSRESLVCLDLGLQVPLCNNSTEDMSRHQPYSNPMILVVLSYWGDETSSI